MRKLFKYFSTVKKDLILVPILVIVEVIFEILIPVFMSKLIDDGINAVGGPNQQLIYIYAGLMVGSAIIALYFGIRVTKTTAKVATEFGHNLRQAQFEKIQEYSFENIDKFKTSSLITRMTMDVNMIQQSTNMILRVALRAPSLIVFSIISILLFAGRLALIFLVVSPILIIGFYFIMRFAYRQFIKMFRRIDKMNLTLQEDLIGIRTVKSYTREDYETDRFIKDVNNVREVAIGAEKVVIFNLPLLQFAIGLSFVLVCWFGSQLFVAGNLTEGQFANTITYINQVLFSLMLISQVFLMIVMSRASVNRIIEVLDERPYLKEAKSPDYEVL